MVLQNYVNKKFSSVISHTLLSLQCCMRSLIISLDFGLTCLVWSTTSLLVIHFLSLGVRRGMRLLIPTLHKNCNLCWDRNIWWMGSEMGRWSIGTQFDIPVKEGDPLILWIFILKIYIYIYIEYYLFIYLVLQLIIPQPILYRSNRNYCTLVKIWNR